jgi:hypothetical protein
VLGAFHGAPTTVDLIKRYALEAQRQPIVRLYAERVISGLGSKDYLSEILAVYYAVLDSTRYANDPRTVELVRKPALVLREMAAGKVPSLDCDDLTALLAALYLSLGRQVQVVTVAFAHRFYNGQRQYSHVFLRVKEPKSGAWIVVDPVAAEDTAAMQRRGQAFRIWPLA